MADSPGLRLQRALPRLICCVAAARPLTACEEAPGVPGCSEWLAQRGKSVAGGSAAECTPLLDSSAAVQKLLGEPDCAAEG